MKPKNVKLAIVTVCFHNPEETIACLESFNKLKSGNFTLSYYVVDNEGTVSSSAQLSKRLPKAIILNSLQNLGFAGGSNLGLKQALKKGADSILLVNPDTVVENGDFLIKMLETKADLVAPLIKYRENGQITYDYGGKVDYLFGRNTHLTFHSKSAQVESADYFTGACLLIKKAVFKKIGLLDDSFFLYYEDADFCLRATKVGFTGKLCREAVIFHHLSTTTSKIGKRKISIIAASHLRFCRKHLPLLSTPFYLTFNFYLRLKTL